VKQTLVLADEELSPQKLDMCGDFLLVTTLAQFLRVYDLNRRYTV